MTPVELSIEDDRWQSLDIEEISQAATLAVLAHLNLDPSFVEISVLACDDDRIAVLNGEFRDKSAATNVLSWPEVDLSAEKAGDAPQGPEPDPTGAISLGDIAISFDTCAREAAAAGRPMDGHVTHLIVHGVLHLLGYDHIRDPDATLMEGIETEILGKLGIDNPYIDQ
ncbi:MAG: rRNA maturation RNase YbeY [Sulfitobacter sp.]